MTNAYLTLAEGVLSSTRRPMTPAEIVDTAYISDRMPSHLYGNTQHKTLHARLSEDILRFREKSRFYRTGPGQFFLRRLKDDPQTPLAFRKEFPAPPRRKELRREPILAIQRDALSRSDASYVPLSEIRRPLEQGRYVYARWRDRRLGEQYVGVNSFVVVHRRGLVLSYRCGRFSPTSDFINGKRTIGFGGPVVTADVDLLYDSFFGIIGNGINDLIGRLGLPHQLAEEARYCGRLHPQFGTLATARSSNWRGLQVVLTYECPTSFEPETSALYIRDLRWIDPGNPGNNQDDYDEATKNLFNHRYINDILAVSLGLRSHDREAQPVHKRR